MAKFCGNCGSKMNDEAKVCGMCGMRFLDVDSEHQESATPKSTQGSSVETKISQAEKVQTTNTKQIIVSLLAMLNVIFSPIYDVWGGLFPGKPDSNFWDVVSGNCESDRWVFVLTLTIAIPSVFMFIFSLTQKRVLAKVCGWFGIAGVGYMIINYINQFEFSGLFDFKDGNLCFGFWIGLILFVVMIFMPTKKRTQAQ